MGGYSHRVNNERQEINEEVLVEWGSYSWNWDEFMKIMLQVPEEYRDVSIVELDGDNDSCKLIISYRRYETEVEYDERIQRGKNREALSEDRAECDERALFERLNVKYGPGGTARVAKHTMIDTRLPISPLRPRAPFVGVTEVD